MKKITVIGNIASGKTVLSRKLAKIHDLPLTHVDSIQFLSGLKMRPFKESIKLLQQVQKQDKWIIDGYGPLDILQERLRLSDQIIFIDLPLKRLLYWLFKRQIKNIFIKRKELPADCREATVDHTKRLVLQMLNTHQRMRPEMLRILARDEYKAKTVIVRTVGEFKVL